MPFAPLISVVNLYDSPIPPSIFSCPLDNVIFVRSLCVNESGLIWMWRYEQLVVVHFLWIRIYGCRCDVRQTPSRAVSLLPKGSEKVIPGTWYEYSHRTCLLCLQCVHVVSDEMWAGAASSPGPRLTTQHCLSLSQAGSAVRRPASAAVTQTRLLLVSRGQHGPLIGQCDSSLASEWLILLTNKLRLD